MATADIRIVRAKEELRHAMACLQDELSIGHGPSPLRAEAITHVRQALLLLTGSHPTEIEGRPKTKGGT